MKHITYLSALAMSMLCATPLAQADEAFKVTTIQNGQFAPNTTWYTLTIGGNRVSSNKGATYITLGGATDKGLENQWCVTGSATEGYKFYNRLDGATKPLIAPTEMKGQNGGESYPILGELKAGYTDTWEISTSAQGGYYINEKGYEKNKMNNRNGRLAFWTGGADLGSSFVFSAVNASFTVDMTTGQFTKSNAAKTWASEWKSNATNPQLVISTPTNDFGKQNNTFVLASGQDQNNTVSITAGPEYVVTGYKFTFKNMVAGTKGIQLTANGKTYEVTDKEQQIEVTGLKDMTTADFGSKGPNKGVLLTNFEVTVERAFRELEPQQNLFVTMPGKTPYRIPAICTAKNGQIVAISDYRPCGGDIGFGEVDIKARISTDNGKTWGPEFFIANGLGEKQNKEFWKIGFGDAAVVADAERNEILIMMVCGKTVCWNGNYTTDPATSNPNRVAQVRGKFNETTQKWEWTEPKEVTESIYPLFVDENGKVTVQSLFMGSGRICQSRMVKVGDYYRIYAAVWTKNQGNRVIYSDDFGTTWHILGTVADRPAPGGDEPKCEELPDGTVILSSRMNGGRFYNYYTYTDVKSAKGSWGKVAASNAANKGTACGNSTNGEIMILPVVRNSDQKEMYLALQSIPFGNGRNNVGIYYKELASLNDFVTPDSLAANWDGKHQSSFIGSCYSTMSMTADDKLAFIYEEETFGAGYTQVLKLYTIDYITKGAYTLKKDVDREAYVVRMMQEKVEAKKQAEAGEAVGMLDAAKLEDFKSALNGLVEEYAKNTSAQGYADVIAKLNEALLANSIQMEDGMSYTLLNKGRQGKYLQINGATEYGNATTGNTDAQKFVFSVQPDGSWVIINKQNNKMMSPTQKQYAHVTQVDNATEAGKFRVNANADGWSTVVCTNPVQADLNALHMAGEGHLVEWYASEPASQWKIVPTGEKVETGIGCIETPDAPNAELRMYDLQGRRLIQAPAKGFYITSDGKKHLVK